MSTNAVLIVLAAREPGMRSLLTVRLSMPGVDLVTAQHPDDAVLRRNVRRAAVLVLDAATVDAHPHEWLDALLEDPHWRCILVVTAADRRPVAHPRIEYVAQAEIAARIAALLPLWSNEDRD